MIDTLLIQSIVDLKVPIFGESMKNKGDSQSCMFDPRKLLSDCAILKYVGNKMSKIIHDDCQGNALVGMATSGIAWAAVASVYSGLPMLYVRKKLEPNVSNKHLEGILPTSKKVILIDDLLFAGESKNEAIEILHNLGCLVTDVLVVIDRQIQRKKDGPSIEDRWKLKLHSLITMSEIIDYMKQKNEITHDQYLNLIQDYQQFERWDMPDFAKGGVLK